MSPCVPLANIVLRSLYQRSSHLLIIDKNPLRGKQLTAYTYTEKSGALLEELRKVYQLLNRAFVLAPSYAPHGSGDLGFHAGWAGSDCPSEAMALNEEKGNLGHEQ